MNPLHSRNTSGFALSISTGLAMETLFQPRTDVFDPERVAPPRINIADYSHLWINVLTLIRNAYNAMGREEAYAVASHDMAEVILQEMGVIRDLLKIEGGGFCQPVFYFTDYTTLFKSIPDIFKMRIDKSDIQLRTRDVFNKSKLVINQSDSSILNFRNELKGGEQQKALMLTHLPLDLLSANRFRYAALLESHTGKIKTKSEWNTKYHKLGEDSLDRLPFCRQLLYIFGDNVSITPMSVKIRRSILEIGKLAHWTPVTSAQRVANDIVYRLPDPALAAEIRKIPVF